MIIESLYKYKNNTLFIVNAYAIENLLKHHDNDLPSIDIQQLFPQDENSKELMIRRTNNIAEKSSMRLAAGELHVQNKYISLTLNNDYYCISLDYVKEVLKDATITNVPGTPDFIEGIMNLRGDYITVINLKNFLALPNETTLDKKPVIIIKCNELKLALLIDKINELFECSEQNAVEQTESYYASEFIYNKNLYTVLNIEKLTSDKKIIITDM
jgi:chemotaxis signal transduction protein